MLDTLLSRLKEEIAIDGNSGSRIDTVWKYVEIISKETAKQLDMPIVPTVDASYKAFLWNYIRQEPELEFYQEANQPSGTTASLDTAAKNDSLMEEVDPVQDTQVQSQIADQTENAVAMEATEDETVLNRENEETPSMAQNTHEQEELNSRKRKPTLTKKAAKPKKKAKPKPKPKKKKPAKKKKAAYKVHSDSDFEMDSDNTSESEESDFSEEASSEDSQEEEEDDFSEDEFDNGNFVKKRSQQKKPVNASNPRAVEIPTENQANLNLTAIENIADLSYDQVQELYDCRLRIIASSRLQEEQIYIGLPPNCNLAPTLLVILKEIIKTRTKGLYQASITKLLNFDARSTGYYAKTLEDKGAISRRGVSINSMFTNICVHARFCLAANAVDMNTAGEKMTENEIPYNVNGHGIAFTQKAVLHAMVDFARVAPNGVILAQDVLHGLGFDSKRKAVRKWFNRTIDELCLKGYFEKGDSKLDGNITHRCLRLLKTPQDNGQAENNYVTTVSQGPLVFPIRIKSTRNTDIPIHHLLCDVPIESQCLDVLAAADTSGVTQKDISIALNIDEHRILSRILEKMVDLKITHGLEQLGAVRYLEFEGRVRRYRYFTYAASIRNNENSSYVPPPLPETDFDESKCYERHILEDLPHTMKEFQNYCKLIKMSGGNRNIIMNNRNQLFMKSKILLNRDGTPRKKSRYLLNKEKKLAEQAAAQARAAKASDNPSPSTTTDTSGDPLPIHSFFTAQKPSRRGRPAAKPKPPSSKEPTPISAPLEGPAPTPTFTENVVPCPAVDTSRKSCPTTAKKTKMTQSTLDEPASKKRKSNNAESTEVIEKRTTRSGRVIPYIDANEPNSVTEDLEQTVTESTSELAAESMSIEAASHEAMNIDTDSSKPTEATQTPETVDESHQSQEEPTSTEAAVADPTSEPSEAMNIDTDLSKPTEATQIPEAVDESHQSQMEPTATDLPEPAVESSSTSTSAKAKEQTSSHSHIIVKPVVPKQAKRRLIADYFTKVPKSTPRKPIEISPTPSPQPASPSNNIESNTQSDVNAASELEVSAVSESETSTVAQSNSNIDAMPVSEVNVASQASVASESAVNAAPQQADDVVNEQIRNEPNEESIAMEVSDNQAAMSNQQPSTASPSPNVSEISTYKRCYHHKRKDMQVNSYLEARIKVMYEYLEEIPIAEMGKAFIDEFTKRADAQNKNSKHTIDNKTMWKTALELEKRGQAKTRIVECHLLNGRSYQRKLVLHRDMDTESTEYKDFVAYIQERRTIQQMRKAPKRVEKFKEPVLRLSEQIEIMQKEAKELSESGKTKEAIQLEHRINDLSKNLEKFGRALRTSGVSSWMIDAMQNGWINARMIRVKVFHKYIFRLFEDNLQGVDQQKHTVTITAIIDNMTLHLFSQVIGIFRATPLIEEYARTGEHQQMKLVDLPDDFKKEIFDQNTKFLRRIRLLLNTLQYLRIMTAQYTQIQNSENFDTIEYASLAPSYKLEKKVPIIDRTKRDEPVLREHNIDAMEDLLQYWTDLRYVSTFKNAVVEEQKELSNPHEKEIRRSLCSIKNWSTKSVFSRLQRKRLNELVDRAHRKTPLDEPMVMKGLAEELQISFDAVKSYYEKVAAALERRYNLAMKQRMVNIHLGKFRRRKRSRISKYNVYEGRRVINFDSEHAFLIQQQSKKAGGHRRDKAGAGYLDNMQNLPVIREGDDLNQKPKRKKKLGWTEQEEEILLYVYAILKHRSKNNGGKFWWAPAAQVFSDKDISTARHRITKLMAQPLISEKFESYLVQWGIFYKEGLANGDIKDEHPDDNINVDLLSYMEYFILRLQGQNESLIDVTLPSTLADLYSTFDLIPNVNNNATFEDSFHEYGALVQKLQVLLQCTFNARRYADSTYDQPESMVAIDKDPTGRISNIIKRYALMTLMTPAEYFDPFYAFQILGRFSPSIKEQAFETMRAEKTLILANGDRPVPGTRMALSVKFIRSMRGQLPEGLFSQAKKYERFLDTQTEKFKFSPIYVSSGMMACLLNLLSSNQLSLSLSNLSLQLKSILKTGSNIRGFVDKSLKHLELDIQKINAEEHDQSMTHLPNTNYLHIKLLRNDEYEKALTELLQVQDEGEGILLKSVIDALYTEGESGLTLFQLKTKLSGSYSDQDILMAVHKLSFNDPALVCRVGFDAVSYVHINFISSWSIVNHNIEKYELDASKEEEIMKEANGRFHNDVARKDVILPSLWIDINGNTTDLILKGCKEAIIDLVLRKPGIPEAEIYRHMSTGLCRREVRDLLDILVEQQCLRQIQVQIIPQTTEKKHSLFAKRTTLRCTNNNSIEELTQTCFWITPSAFASL